jgi:hypothetical protein
MEKRTEFNIWYWVLAFMAVLLVQSWVESARQVAPICYSQFERYVAQGRIASVAVGADRITGIFKTPLDGRSQFVTTIVDPAILARIDEADIEIINVAENTWIGTILSWVVPVFVFFALWMFVFRKFAEKQGFGGFMQVGRSKARIYMEKKTGVSFADVAGVDEAKAELEEIVAFLQDPGEYGRLVTSTHQLPGQKKQRRAEYGRDTGDRNGQCDGHCEDEEQRPEGTVSEAFDQVTHRDALVWCGWCIRNSLKDVGLAPRFASAIRIGWAFDQG